MWRNHACTKQCDLPHSDCPVGKKCGPECKAIGVQVSRGKALERKYERPSLNRITEQTYIYEMADS